MVDGLSVFFFFFYVEVILACQAQLLENQNILFSPFDYVHLCWTYYLFSCVSVNNLFSVPRAGVWFVDLRHPLGPFWKLDLDILSPRFAEDFFPLSFGNQELKIWIFCCLYPNVSKLSIVLQVQVQMKAEDFLPTYQAAFAKKAHPFFFFFFMFLKRIFFHGSFWAIVHFIK